MRTTFVKKHLGFLKKKKEFGGAEEEDCGSDEVELGLKTQAQITFTARSLGCGDISHA